MTGAELIAREYERQIAEGHTPEHDDQHVHDELVRAAICYAYPPQFRHDVPLKTGELGEGWVACSTGQAEVFVPELWPFNPREWQPGRDRVRELTKAGYLIAAEIDRLIRMGAK